MPKSSTYSAAASWPSKNSQGSKRRAHASQPRSERRSTTTTNGSGKRSGRPSGSRNRNRRSELLRRLKIDEKALAAQAQISPLLKQCGILPARVIEVLRADVDDAALAIVSIWDSLTPANRHLLGLEALAVAAGMTPRRLWELYSGANMMQSRELVGNMILNALPSIMAVTIRTAKKTDGYSSREHIYKAARVLPTPKGSVINIGTKGQDELESGDEDDGPGGMLEEADGFLMKASRAMSAKALPAPAVIDAEVLEDE